MEKDYDIYNLIRVEEIRKHFRKNRLFTILEQEKIITHSYCSIISKWQMLRWLRDKAVDGDREMVDNMVRLYDEVISEIFVPYHRSLFIHQYLEPVYTYADTDISDLFYYVADNYIGYYALFDDLRKHLEQVRKESKQRRWEKQSKVQQIYVLENGQYSREITFSLIWENGLYYPKDFIVNDRWLQKHNISKETYQRKQDYISDYELPYQNGDHIKITLPFWKKPIYGTFQRYTKNGTVHQSFFLNGQEHISKNELDMSCQDFTLSSGYCVWDWLDRYFTGNVEPIGF